MLLLREVLLLRQMLLLVLLRVHHGHLVALILLVRSGLLGDGAPDVGTRLQIANVPRLGIIFISRLDRFLAEWGLTGAVQHLLLLDGTRDLGSLAGEVEVLSNILDGFAAEGVVVQDIIGFIELVAEAIVGLFEVKAGLVSRRESPFSVRAGRGTYAASSPWAPWLDRPAQGSGVWPKPGALA